MGRAAELGASGGSRLTRTVESVLGDHLRGFFAGHPYEEKQWKQGPAIREIPDLRIAEVAPGPKWSTWFYSTIGAWQFGRKPGGIELFMLSPERNDRFVELLTINAYYHRNHRLGLHHTAPLGEPLVPGSNLEYVYISLPYPFGPTLEVCDVGGEHIHFYWVFPITRAEKDLVSKSGHEALEQLFEDKKVEYWSPFRRAVVESAT